MAEAKWLVHVDWNGDGDFSDANEDVSADVLGLTLEHFRDLSSEHTEAARLELELKNDDHKYSPPNSGSPLSPNPPKDTDGRREGSGRGWVRELQGRWPGLLG